MKAESKRLSTADLAQAGNQSSPESISDRPSAHIAGSNHGLLEPEPVQGPPVREQERAAEQLQAQMAGATPDNRPQANAPDATTAPLFKQREADELRGRWNEIQVGFVDEPRTAVERADSLVAETIKRLAESFAGGRQKLEGEWGRGGDASTETLRVALQRYRSFFNRLLSI